MPRSHSIIYNLSHFPYYNSNLQRIAAAYASYRRSAWSIVDVGANIGDTMLMLRQVTDKPIHCFEGDRFYYHILEQNARGIPGVRLHALLLAEKPETIRVKNNSKLGTSQFVADAEQGEELRFDSLDHFFQKEATGEDIGLIKTDTDGYDLRILRGAKELLRRYQPVIFMEYDRGLFEQNQDDGLSFLHYLQELGYEDVLVYDNFGKLLTAVKLSDSRTIALLHSYIRFDQLTIPFYDLALFSLKDAAFVKDFIEQELIFYAKPL